MKNPVILGLFLVAIGVATALADEGRVPIFQVTSISQPGTYVLTRNIGAMVGSAITIQASNVTLDLNGMTVTTSDAFAPIIQIGDNFEGIHIRDGRLGGGSYVIFYGTGGGESPSTIWIENVEISQTGFEGVYLTNLRQFEMTACKLHNLGGNGVLLVTGGGAFAGRIVGNQFTVMRGGIIVGSSNNLLIQDNVMSGLSSYGINLGSSRASIVRGNTLIAASGNGGGGIVTGSGGNLLIVDNFLDGFTDGVSLGGGAGSRVSGNVIRNMWLINPTAGHGIGVGGTGGALRNLIEGNQIEGNAGCGIRFDATASSNVYRNNMLRGNTGGAVCNAGVGNTDAGGNVL